MIYRKLLFTVVILLLLHLQAIYGQVYLSEDKTVQQTTLPRINVKTAGGGYYYKNIQEVLDKNAGIDVCLFL